MFRRDESTSPVSSAMRRWLTGVFGDRARHVEEYRGRRVHIELRRLAPDTFASFADELTVSLDRLDGVEGYHVNGLFDRLVVSYRAPVTTPRRLVRLVEGVEQYCGVASEPFPERFADFPGVSDRLVRQWTEFLADLLAIAVSVGLKVVHREPSEAEFDLAAFMSFVEDSPRLRDRLELMAGPEVFELVLGALNSFVQAVGSGPAGPLVDLLQQIALLRGNRAQRTAWCRLEPLLGPDRDRTATLPVDLDGRPDDLPAGAIERYADEAWFASIGGFLVALADTHELESSTSPLFGGLPKALRYGRTGFVAELLRGLAARDVLVFDPQVLESLDRLETLLVDGALLARAPAHTELLVDVAERLEMSVRVTGVDDERARSVGARPLQEGGAERLERIRELQRVGGCVAVVGDLAPAVMRAADLAVGLTDRWQEVPWAADLVGSDIDDAIYVLQAVGEARRIADQSVRVAGLGAGLGTLVALGGVEETDPETVKLAVNAASVAALANGLVRAVEFDRRPRPTPRDPTPWHGWPTDRVLDELDSSRRGLEPRQVAERERTPPAPPSNWKLAKRAVSRELANPMTPLLAATSLASAVVGSPADAALVGSVLGINTAVGGLERYRAERAMQQMREGRTPTVRVRRGGTWRTVEAEALVCGDLVGFRPGEVVPADCRIVSSSDLEVDESALTGESTPARKSARPTRAEVVAERSSMLYDGTSIAGGEATAVVVATGERTEANRRDAPIAEAGSETGIEQRLRELTDVTIPLSATAGGFVTAVGLIRGRDLHSLVHGGLGLAVAAVPEGLPLLATASQLAAARRLAEHEVLVRNPRAIEALGRVDVLCADKTGTLTEGRIRLAVVSDGKRRVEVDPDTPEEPVAGRLLERTVRTALRASPEADADERIPHPTDRAIVEGARRLEVDAAGEGGRWHRVDELRFQPRRGYHGVLGETAAGPRIVLKGAPEVLLELCSEEVRDGGRVRLEAPRRSELLDRAERFAAEGLRVLCLADRRAPSAQSLSEQHVDELTFRGFVGLRDPARPTAASAIDRLDEAGIRTLMITGDHPKTAAKIATEVGLDGRDELLTGPEIERMSDATLDDVVTDISIVARVTPTQKGRIVRSLQRTGRTVAMAGDGANDAAAIRLAEVGMALGPDATSAARDAADIVVVDENIETMVHAVGEGRAMVESVRDAVAILAGGNFGEIGFSVVGSLVRSCPPLNARQLLLVNLMTDIAPSMAIALRRPEDDHLERLLEQNPADVLRGQLDRAIAVRAVATAGGAAAAWSASGVMPGGRRGDSTVALLALVGSQLGQTIFVGHPTRETLAAGLGSATLLLGTVLTPGLSQVFGCRPVGPLGLGVAGASSAAATAGAALAAHYW